MMMMTVFGSDEGGMVTVMQSAESNDGCAGDSSGGIQILQPFDPGLSIIKVRKNLGFDLHGSFHRFSSSSSVCGMIV